MRIKALAAFSAAWLAAGLMGCNPPQEPAAPTVARVAAQTPEAYSSLYEAAAEQLRDNYFRLDRQDRLAGVLTTHPETTANWFELWRPQPQSAFLWLEANAGTIQRQATVRLEPIAGEPGSYDIGVEVQRLRYSLQERQIDNSAAAMRLYSDAAPTTEGRMERASQTAYWIPLGRDALAEQQLLESIVTRYSRMPPAPPATRPAGLQPAP